MNSNEKIVALQEKTSQIADIMTDNIYQLNARSENMTDIHDKSDDIREKSKMFHKEGKKARRRTTWYWRIYYFVIRR